MTVDVEIDLPEPSNGRRSRKPFLERYRPAEIGLAALFLLPAAIVFAVFYYAPFVTLIGWGRFKAQRGGSYRDVGWGQFGEVLTGDEFRKGLTHSVLFVLYTVPAGLVLGILLAVAAHRHLKGIKIFQTIFSSTLASSVAVSSVLFFYLLNPEVGYWKVDWLEREGWSLFATALPSIWQNLGLAFIIVLAGLQAVPDEVLEASRLDGHSGLRRLLTITLPLIAPVLMFLLVVLVVFGFQAFAQIEILTAGGPAGSSETLVYKIYKQRQNAGVGAILSVGLFAVTFVVTAIQFLILDRRVHYDN